MRRGALSLALALALALPVAAAAPERSPRPEPRPALEPAAVSTANLRLRLNLPRELAAQPSLAPWRAPAAPSDPVRELAAQPPLLPLPVAAVPPVPARTPGALVVPRARPAALVRMAPEAVLPSARAEGALRPRARPAALVRPRNAARLVDVVQVASVFAINRSPRPEPRPENLRRRSVVLAAGMVPTQPDPRAIIGRRGALCGDPAIRGETIAPIAGRVSGCGVDEPVRVTEVDGVRLSTAITVDCTTAGALRQWVSDTVKPSVGRLGGGVSSLDIYAHYACRPRNNQRGAKISEHGRGRAVDIGAVVLANGAAISVLDGWRDDQQGQILRAMHRGACGTFGTVLGPEADRFHQNHLHLDTARGRRGAYCR